jgi:hypothetical protein
MANTLTKSIVVGFVLVLAAVAPVAATVPTDAHADQEASISGTPSTSATLEPANNTTTTTTRTTTRSDGLTPEKVVSLITAGEASNRADEVTTWLAEHGGELSENQATVAYRWLLARGAESTASVDGAALASVSGQLSEARARGVVRDLSDSLSSADAERLRDRLDGLGAGWSLDVSSWLQEASASTTTTTTRTTTRPHPTGSDSAPDNGAVFAQVDNATTIRSVEYHDSNQTFVIVIDAEMPRSVVISDNLAAQKAHQGVSEVQAVQVPQKRLYLDRGTTTIRIQAATWRGKTGITVATTGGAISLNNGVPAPNPFGASSGTTGWLGGAGIVAASFVGAAIYKKRHYGTEPVRAGDD